MGKSVVVKERFSKGYRHPVLDAKLTQQRLKSVRELNDVSRGRV